jgi:glutathione peroxidase
VTSKNVYSMSAAALGGGPVDLSKYAGKVALVVNVASECGYTPQYAGLEKLWREYQGKGLVVLGFPSNEFGAQEPGDAATIQEFCTKNYGVTFPLFAKCETKKGAGQSPVYAYLAGATGKEPNWNFCKYLVGKHGEAVKFWPSKTAPDNAELRAAIDAALAAK